MSAIYLIAVPLLVAFISILSKKAAPYLLILVSFLSVVGLVYLEPTIIMIGGYAAPYGISLVVNEFSIAALYIVNILFFIVVTVNISKFKELSSILLVALAGLNGLLLTGDLFNLFVFIEISGIAAYLITTTNKKPLATFNYLVLGTVGSSLYLLGLIILYSMFGTLNFAELVVALEGTSNYALVSFPILLMFIGLGVEAKLLPFNSWVKGILGSSNSLSGPMIASVYAAAVGLLFGKIVFSFSPAFDNTLVLIITGILLFSIIAGEAMAYASTKAKEVLLFSSVAQAGLAVLVFMNGMVGLGLVMLGANALSKLVLFLVITKAEEQVGSDELDNMQGIFSKNAIVGVGFTASVLSVLGLPLFVGFVVKLNVLTTFVDSGNVILPAVILITSIVEGVYFIKMLVKLWYSKSEAPSVKFEASVKYVAIVATIVLVAYGVLSGNVENLVDYVQDYVANGGIL